MSAAVTFVERFWERVDLLPAEPEGCVLWGRATTAAGYGQVWDGTTALYAHRVAYELTFGRIADGLVIDHECHNRDLACAGGACAHRRCVNPMHLAVKGSNENVDASPRAAVNRTHCPQGHPYVEGNIYRRSNGHRQCRTCVLARIKLAQQRRKSEIALADLARAAVVTR